jgi:hypothetical protein
MLTNVHLLSFVCYSRLFTCLVLFASVDYCITLLHVFSDVYLFVQGAIKILKFKFVQLSMSGVVVSAIVHKVLYCVLVTYNPADKLLL